MSDIVQIAGGILGAVWFVVAIIGCSYLNDVQRGRVPRAGGIGYDPPEDVSPERWARMILWPITLVLLLPLGVWLVIKFIFTFLAGIGSIYKENA